MRARIAVAIATVGCLGIALSWAGGPSPVSHTDNGRRIFQHGTTASGRVVQNSHGMEGVGCAIGHGPDGRGGMMHGIPSPDITYSALTDSKGHEHEFMNRRHPPFNRETIKAAIVAGIDSGGNTLHEEMPRWTGLSPADLEDLIDYLQVLSQGRRRTMPGPERM